MMSLEEAVQAVSPAPFSKPGSPSSWPPAQPLPPPAALTVQLKVVLPDAPVPSVAVMVTELVPAVVGVPETAPVEPLMDKPAGRPAAV